MKRSFKIILIILLAAVAGGWFYWQYYKKGFVRNKIENAVSKGTDSVYYIHYDSSSIDEIGGNATFYNITLQSDSLQQQLMMFDTASKESVYNVRIEKVSVKAANIPALVSNTKVEAGSIEITNPVIYIISAGKKEKKQLDLYDTLAIYKKLLGKYNSINARDITITGGHIYFADKTGTAHTAVEGISVKMKNFRIDSTRDYNNIISYFVKDLVAKVQKLKLRTGNKFITLSDLEYNAPGKFIRLKKFLEEDSSGQVVFDINNSSINNIITDSFIFRQQVRAGNFQSEGGLIKLYRTEHAGAGNEHIEFENNSFDEIFVDAINISKTKILVYNKAKPAEPPFILNNASFSANGIGHLYSGSNIIELIGKSNWVLAAEGFSFLSKDKIYKFIMGDFEINKAKASVFMKNFSMTPQVTDEAFVKSLKYQQDIYRFTFNNIQLNGVDIPSLISRQKLLAGTVSLQPVLNIFNDRTVAPNPAAKLFLQQQLLNINFPVDIQTVLIQDGSIKYSERGAVSKQKGTVTFEHVNGKIQHVTNIKDAIKENNKMVVNASGTFMGVSKIKTTWNLLLNSSNNAFTASGSATGFDAKTLNSIAEPLGMASIKTGRVNKLSFDFAGDYLQSKGTSTLLYQDLTVELLKKDSNELRKKGLSSFIANLLAKNNNPQNGNLKEGKISFQRDTTKSFFNLLWKSIFDGAKTTIQKL